MRQTNLPSDGTVEFWTRIGTSIAASESAVSTSRTAASAFFASAPLPFPASALFSFPVSAPLAFLASAPLSVMTSTSALALFSLLASFFVAIGTAQFVLILSRVDRRTS